MSWRREATGSLSLFYAIIPAKRGRGFNLFSRPGTPAH